MDGTMTIISRHCCWPVSPTTSASAASVADHAAEGAPLCAG